MITQVQLRRYAMTFIALVFSAGVCHADGLTDKVLQAPHTQAPALTAIAKTDDELQVSGKTGPVAVYLSNVRAACVPQHELLML